MLAAHANERIGVRDGSSKLRRVQVFPANISKQGAGGFACRRRRGRQFLLSPMRQLGITVQLPSGPFTKPYWILATSGLPKIAGWSTGLTPARLHGVTLPPCGSPCCACAGAPASESTEANAIAQPSIFHNRIMLASMRFTDRTATLRLPSKLVKFAGGYERLPNGVDAPTDLTRVILSLGPI